MMLRETRSENLRDRRGFTMIEIIVSLVIGLILLTSVVQMMIVQGRSFRKQREQVDVRETAREAAQLLSWDLRQAAVAGSPFVAMGPNNLTVRSPRGLGTICAQHATLPRYGLWKTAGSIQATVDDTALVYQIGKGTWLKAKITAVGTPRVRDADGSVRRGDHEHRGCRLIDDFAG
jgi:prepilin-type N-terminal cleavage/methylation domain-containing protein